MGITTLHRITRIIPNSIDESLKIVNTWRKAGNPKLTKEMEVWLNESISLNWAHDIGTMNSIWFNNEEDVVKFKLTWL